MFSLLLALHSFSDTGTFLLFPASLLSFAGHVLFSFQRTNTNPAIMRGKGKYTHINNPVNMLYVALCICIKCYCHPVLGWQVKPDVDAKVHFNIYINVEMLN